MRFFDEVNLDRTAHRKVNFGWFGIKHFAGAVIYNVEGFVEKNKDIVNSQFNEMMSQTNNSVIRCFRNDLEPTSVRSVSQIEPTPVRRVS